MPAMKVVGMKARWSPMQGASEQQREAIEGLIAGARDEGEIGTITVRHSTWIGHGCLADHGAITVDADGRIYANVFPDGRVSY